MIILVNALKLWIELIKYINDNAEEKFYLVHTFSKVRILVEISKMLKNLEKMKYRKSVLSRNSVAAPSLHNQVS